jgi:Holliday junction resolvase RusA-like endonuclease
VTDALHYVFDGINPEPWEAPQASTGRRGKKIFTTMHSTSKQRFYQDAIKEMADELLEEQPFNLNPPYDVRFFFWRDTTGGAMVADATNLQKSTEDALQGKFYSNDRYNPAVSSVIIDQGPHVLPAVLVVIGQYDAEAYSWAADRLHGLRGFDKHDRVYIKPDDHIF